MKEDPASAEGPSELCDILRTSWLGCTRRPTQCRSRENHQFPNIQAYPEIIKWEQRNRCSTGNTNLTDLTADKNNTISPFNTTDYKQTGHYSSRWSSKQDSWKRIPCTPCSAKLTCSSKSHQRWNTSLNNCSCMIQHHRGSYTGVVNILWGHNISCSKQKGVLVRTVSEIELFHCMVHCTD